MDRRWGGLMDCKASGPEFNLSPPWAPHTPRKGSPQRERPVPGELSRWRVVDHRITQFRVTWNR